MPKDIDALIDAMVAASRTFVGVAAESVAELSPDLTLPQYRLLVVLATRGPQNLNTLAEALGVTPSTVSRMCDRLLVKKLIRRDTNRADRRQVRLRITPSGGDLYEAVMERRRARMAEIATNIRPSDRAAFLRALRAFSEASDHAPSHAWAAGWTEPDEATD